MKPQTFRTKSWRNSLGLTLAIILFVAGAARVTAGTILFSDGFESGLVNWTYGGSGGSGDATTIAVPDEVRGSGQVLAFNVDHSGGDLYSQAVFPS